MELLHYAAQRNAAAAKLLNIILEQVVLRAALFHERVHRPLNVIQVLNACADAARHLAAQQNIAVPLHNALQVIVIQICQRAHVIIHIAKRPGNQRHRHHQIRGKEYLVLAHMHHTHLRTRAGRVDNMHRLPAETNHHPLVKDQLGQADLHLAQFGCMLLRLLQRCKRILLQHGAALFMRHQFGVGKQIGAVDMVRMGHCVDHIADALGTDPPRKVNDLARLRRKGQRINQNAPFLGDDQPGVDLQVQPTGKDPCIIGDPRTNNSHCALLACSPRLFPRASL